MSDSDPVGVVCVCVHVSVCQTVILVCPVCLWTCVHVSDSDPVGFLCVCGHVSVCQTVILVCPVCLWTCVHVSDCDPGVSCVFVSMCPCVRL